MHRACKVVSFAGETDATLLATAALHIPGSNDLIDGYPKNSQIAKDIRLCRDGRGMDCPYCLILDEDNAYYQVSERLCLYGVSKHTGL